MKSPAFNIADLFELVAGTVPERTALVCNEQRRTYQELDRRSSQLAAGLLDAGIGADQHVGMYMRNCVEYVESMLACFKIRAVPININYRYIDKELNYLFGNADIVACIYQPEFSERVARLLNEGDNSLTLSICTGSIDSSNHAGTGSECYENMLSRYSASTPLPTRSGKDKFVLYTGGTTGHPKGVLWDHESLYFATLGGDGRGHPDGAITEPSQVATRIDPDRKTIMAPLAPLMHGAAWWPTTSALLAGNTVVLYGGKSFNAQEAAALLQAERVNALAMVGDAMAIPLLRAMQNSESLSGFSHLRVVGSGGAVFSSWVQEAFRELLPQAMVLNAFGSSETGSQGNDTGASQGGMGTLPVTDICNVIGNDRTFTQPGSGDIGILAKSGFIPLGYYGDAEATARTFIELEGKRWVLTGDMATVTAEGNITVFGRGSNCINSGGEKVFPEEVEQVLKAHPAIEDALVVGVSDERLGSRVAAVLSAASGQVIDEDDVSDFLRNQLAGYKIPREYRITDRVQRSPAGKPDYAWAKQQLTQIQH